MQLCKYMIDIVTYYSSQSLSQLHQLKQHFDEAVTRHGDLEETEVEDTTDPEEKFWSL